MQISVPPWIHGRCSRRTRWRASCGCVCDLSRQCRKDLRGTQRMRRRTSKIFTRPIPSVRAVRHALRLHAVQSPGRLSRGSAHTDKGRSAPRKTRRFSSWWCRTKPSSAVTPSACTTHPHTRPGPADCLRHVAVDAQMHNAHPSH